MGIISQQHANVAFLFGPRYKALLGAPLFKSLRTGFLLRERPGELAVKVLEYKRVIRGGGVRGKPTA
jgi:hypothetical protein